MRWFHPGLITHGSSSSILEHSSLLTNTDSQPVFISLENCHIQFADNSHICTNFVMDIVIDVYNIIVDGYFFSVDVITLLSFVNFWSITLIIFLQSWEILINYTNTFNNKQTIIQAKTALINYSKLTLNSSKNLTKYYL